jgi:hypothetical protein
LKTISGFTIQAWEPAFPGCYTAKATGDNNHVVNKPV